MVLPGTPTDVRRGDHMKACPGSSSHIRAVYSGLRVTLVKTAEGLRG